MRGTKVVPYHTSGYPMPWGFNGLLAGPYRFLAGRPMNGHRYTDATYWRYGTMSMDPSGHASSYHLLPGALRFLYFRLPILLIIPAAIASWLWPMVMYYLGCVLILVATWRVQRWRARYAFRRDVIEPVDAAASAILQVRRDAGRGHTRVDIPRDFRDNPDAKVTLRLPMEFVGQPGDRENLVKAVAAKLNVDELSPSWNLHGGAPTVTLSMPAAPPQLVDMKAALGACLGLEAAEIMLGLGPRDRPETFSLAMESPHAILNGGSGAGKSVLLAFIVAQFMRRGSGVIVLDAKYISHPWLRRVPGVHYASSAEDMHNALVWLDAELIRRAELVSMAPDIEAAARALPLLTVVMEEMTAARNRLDQYWKSIKGPGDPALSPALAALANVANMGRQMRVHAFLAGQSLTARVTGGPEGRESYGARMLARATSNAWKMLAPQIKPAPVKRERPGRWHIVVGDTLRAFQAPWIDLEDSDVVAELIEWATSGAPIVNVSALIDGWEPDEATTPEPENPSLEAVTSLRDYVAARGGESLTLPNLRQWVNRYAAESGLQVARVGPNRTALYRWEDLDQFVGQRLREPASETE